MARNRVETAGGFQFRSAENKGKQQVCSATLPCTMKHQRQDSRLKNQGPPLPQPQPAATSRVSPDSPCSPPVMASTHLAC